MLGLDYIIHQLININSYSYIRQRNKHNSFINMSSSQLRLFEPGDFLTIKEASIWASEYLRKDVTPSNIAYLINYGRIHKYGENGNACISKQYLKFILG